MQSVQESRPFCKRVGIALLTRRPTLPLLTEDIVAIDIEPRIITNINLSYPKNQTLSVGARRFINLVNTHTA